MAFPIEKEPSLYEEEPDVFQDENEESNEVESLKKRFFFGQNQNYCCTANPPCHITPPECFGLPPYGNTQNNQGGLNYGNAGGIFGWPGQWQPAQGTVSHWGKRK
ncbi:hypothetical protein ACROYT_G029201 [Oculina patagonica]